MTSDGISDEDWDATLDLMARIANTTPEQNDTLCTRLTQAMFERLDYLERKYGPLPSILATRADYVDDVAARVGLLERSWRCACEMGDRRNCTAVASSLAETYIDELGNLEKGREWLSRLEEALGNCWNDQEYKDFRRLTETVEQLERGSQPPKHDGRHDG